MGFLYVVFRWVVSATVTGSVLAGLILLAKRVAGDRLGARWHYFIWFLFLVRLAVPILPASPVSLYNLVHVDRLVSETLPVALDPSPSTGDPSPLPHTWPGQALPLIVWGWLVGAAGFAAILAAAEILFRSKIARARRAVDPRLLALFGAAKRRMAVRNASLWESDAVGSPVAFGLLRPRLLLPVAMADRLDDEQLTGVFLHELAHVRRQDIVVNWLSAGLRTLHWFNPLVWYSFGRMREDQEVSCDALVLAHLEPGAGRGYGRTVIDLLQMVSAPPTVPSTVTIRSSAALNKRRVTMIALFRKPSLRWTVLGLALAVLIAGMALTNGLARAFREAPPAIGPRPAAGDKSSQVLADVSQGRGDADILIIRKVDLFIAELKLLLERLARERDRFVALDQPARAREIDRQIAELNLALIELARQRDLLAERSQPGGPDRAGGSGN